MESVLKKTRRFWPLVALAAWLLVLMAQPAPAATKTWVGPKPNTLWSNANNWSPAGQPLAGDAVELTSTTNKTAIYDTTLNQSFIALEIDASGGSTFTLLQTANTLKPSIENIGISGKGQVVQSGGTNSNSALHLGIFSGSNGTYTLSGGGSLSTGGDQEIGGAGTGLFNQTGGNNTVGATLTLGFDSTGIGTYNLNGGHLNAQSETVGSEGTGTFTQSTNSTNIISDTLALGRSSGMTISGIGTYYMKGGYLQTLEESVGGGNFGQGTFTQSGGTHKIIHDLELGAGTNTIGVFNLLAGSLSASNELIGVSDNGTGIFTQSGGTNTMNQLALGFNAGTTGVYTLNAGQLQANSIEQVGYGGTGMFTQVGGTHTAKQLIIGDGAMGNGTFNLKKGTLSVTNDETVGNDGIGTFNQTGGTHKVTNLLTVAAGTGSGTYNLQGGSLSAGTPFDGVTDIFVNYQGTFNVKNTTTTVNGDLDNLGTVKTTNANVTWNGRFYTAGAYISDPSTQTFNKDLFVDTDGYLVGASQDLFIVKNDFINHSILGTNWNTVLSTLKFATGADNSHNLYVVGKDNGPHGQANNFTWGSLNLAGQKLYLFDGNTFNTTTALYAEALIGATFSGLTLTDIFNTDTDPINIYYNANLAANAYLHGLDYIIPGYGGGVNGMLIHHTPVPPSVLLLGSGLLGLGALGWRRRERG